VRQAVVANPSTPTAGPGTLVEGRGEAVARAARAHPTNMADVARRRQQRMLLWEAVARVMLCAGLVGGIVVLVGSALSFG
jgi:hypothetical protein